MISSVIVNELLKSNIDVTVIDLVRLRRYIVEVLLIKVRTTGMFFTDGLGHIGGAISPYVILPIAFSAGFLGLSGYVSSFVAMGISALIAGILVGVLGPRTLRRRLEEINPF